MSIYVIDGSELYSYVVSGAKNIIVNEANLNKINFFPVPDGDTGTNLSLTMNSILSSASHDPHVSSTMKSISDIASDHAYGNSGMIFAQYFSGLSQALSSKEFLTPEEFVASLKSSAAFAFRSVTNPKEGTILTVMREWANHLETHLEDDFTQRIELSLVHLKNAVQKTKQQMKVLREHNVVDAGAMAFYYFVEGIAKFLKVRTLDDRQYKAAVLEEVSENLASLDIGEYRYCTQFLVRSKSDLEKIRTELSGMGDSLVLGSGDDHISVHLHTNHPQQVMKRLLEEGTVTSHKVDDMYLQARLIHQPVAKTVIVTDSIADLPQRFIDDNQIVVIPLNLIVDSVVYMDKLTMKPEDFYDKLDDYTMNPTSSQATPQLIERIFRQLLQNYDQILGIFVSSKMSGTFDRIVSVSDALRKEGKQIEILDSKVNSAAQGLLIIEAANLRKAGADFTELVAFMKKRIDDVRIYVSVKDLKYMLKGGRVSKTTGFILSKLKLQPVISIDRNGKGEIFAKSLTQKSAMKTILKTLRNDFQTKGIDRYALVYADDPEDLTDFRRQCESMLGKAPDYIETISPIVGLNAGKGAIAIAYLTKT
ncbi:MAG: DegV family protein [Erysipelotrichaceae bacterium]